MSRVGLHAAIGALLLLAGCSTISANGDVASQPASLGQESSRSAPSSANVLYVTDRAPVHAENGLLSYGADRARYVSFGNASVGSDSRHKVGSVTEDGQFPPTPYAIVPAAGGVRRDVAVVEQHDRAAMQLQAEIAGQLAQVKRKEIVLFVHGYANTFDDAVRSTAELCNSLDNAFVCIALTWPAGGSRGAFMGYNIDRESGEFAVNDLKRMVRIISQTPGLERMHIIAHSRGTDVTASVMQQLGIEAYVSKAALSQKFKICNIILFAPDIDMDVATSKMFGVGSDPDLLFGAKPNALGILPQGNIHLTVYSSPNDRALGLSNRLFGGTARLGQLSILRLPTGKQMTAPSLAQFADYADFIEFNGKAGFIGHSYFLTNPAVSADLKALLVDRLPAGDPGRPLLEIKKPFWKIVEPKLVVATAASPAM